MKLRISPVLLVLSCMATMGNATCGSQGDDDDTTLEPTDTPAPTEVPTPMETPTPTETPVPSDTAEIAALLEAAVEGLYYMSESDYPFTVVTVPGAAATPLTADNIKERIEPIYVNREGEATLEERAVEVKTLEEFFARLITPQDWWEEYNYEQKEQYDVLYEILTTEVVDGQAFRIGEKSSSGDLIRAIDVYLVGSSSNGDLIGVWTISVET